MDTNIIIEANNIWKRYGLPSEHSFKVIKSRLQKKPFDPDSTWALQDISFSLKRGETFGIIGNNGAGKSTLLKILAGVSPTTKGSLSVCGSVFPMIELNAGLNTELSGFENVFLLGAITGFTQKEIKRKLPEIEDFCDLRDWFYEPVWKYSSGMKARLGFGVAMNMEADILLVDEVLSVGDIAFKQKCYDRIADLRHEGVSILLVSHSIRQVERLCNRIMLMEHGRIRELGNPAEIVHLYFNESTETAIKQHEKDFPEGFRFQSAGEVSIEKIEILNNENEPTDTLFMENNFSIRVTYNASSRLISPNIGLSIVTSDLIVASRFTSHNEENRPDWNGRGTFTCKIHSNMLLPGIYFIQINIRRDDDFLTYSADRAAAFRIESEGYDIVRSNYGVVYIPASWEFGKENDN